MQVIHQFDGFLKSSLQNPHARLKVNSQGELEEYSSSFKDRVRYTFSNFKVALLNHFSSKKIQAAVNYQVIQWVISKSAEFANTHADSAFSRFGNVNIGLVTLPTQSASYAKAELLDLLKKAHTEKTDEEIERLLPQASATLKLVEMRVFASKKGFNVKNTWQDFVGNNQHHAKITGNTSLFTDTIAEDAFSKEIHYKELAAFESHTDMEIKNSFEDLLTKVRRLDPSTMGRTKFKTEFIDKFTLLQDVLYGRLAKNKQDIKKLQSSRDNEDRLQVNRLRENNAHIEHILGCRAARGSSFAVNETELLKLWNTCRISTPEELTSTIPASPQVSPLNLTQYLTLDQIDQVTGPNQTIRFVANKETYGLTNTQANRDSGPQFFTIAEARQHGLLHAATCQYLEASLLSQAEKQEAYQAETKAWDDLLNKFRQPIGENGVNILSNDDHLSAHPKSLEKLLGELNENIVVMEHYRSTCPDTPENAQKIADFQTIITLLKARHSTIGQLLEFKVQDDLKHLSFVGQFNSIEGITCFAPGELGNRTIPLGELGQLLYNRLARGLIIKQIDELHQDAAQTQAKLKTHRDVIRHRTQMLTKLAIEETAIRQSLGLAPSIKPFLYTSLPAIATGLQNDLANETAKISTEDRYKMFNAYHRAVLARLSYEELGQYDTSVTSQLDHLSILPIADIETQTTGIHPKLIERLTAYAALIDRETMIRHERLAEEQLLSDQTEENQAIEGAIYPESLIGLYKTTSTHGRPEFYQDLDKISKKDTMAGHQKFINYFKRHQDAMTDEYNAMKEMFTAELKQATTEEEVQTTLAHIATAEKALQAYADEVTRFPKINNPRHLKDLQDKITAWKTQFTPEFTHLAEQKVAEIKNPPPPVVIPRIPSPVLTPMFEHTMTPASTIFNEGDRSLQPVRPLVEASPIKPKEAEELPSSGETSPSKAQKKGHLSSRLSADEQAQIIGHIQAFNKKHHLAIGEGDARHLYISYRKSMVADRNARIAQNKTIPEPEAATPAAPRSAKERFGGFFRKIGAPLARIKAMVPAKTPAEIAIATELLELAEITNLSFNGALQAFQEHVQTVRDQSSSAIKDDLLKILTDELVQQLKDIYRSSPTKGTA